MKQIINLLLIVFLTGCSSILTSNEDVRHFYVLNPAPTFLKVKHPAPVRLNVDDPVLPNWLDVQHIILRQEDNQVDFYYGARWVVNASDMIGILVAQSLENNYIAKDIFYAGAETQADYTLFIEMVDFQADYPSKGAPPVVNISMQAKLIQLPTNQVRYRFTVASQAQAAKNDLSSIMDAFDESFAALMEEVVVETAKGLAVKYEIEQ